VTDQNHAALARLIDAIATPAFAERLTEAAAARLRPDASAFILFSRGAAPSVIVDRLQAAERGHLYGDYLSGVYLLSPFYRASQGLKSARAMRVRDVAPHGFAQSEYCRRYFALIGVTDMLGVLLPAHGGTAFLSFSRGTGRPRFSAADAASVNALLPLLEAALAKHEVIFGPLASSTAAGVARSVAPVRPPGLTAREAEVVNLILEGHSTRAIGERLKIAHETVRVHRRNLYDKLGVSSQAELFRWFLASRA
jgi:DNA-binding CsgD family transcriptional regulator